MTVHERKDGTDMKKKFLLFGLIAAFTFGNVLTANAAEAATVVFGADNKLEFEGMTDGKLGNAFEGMAPGESSTQTITMKNENTKTVDFYMNASALQALEESSAKARGAGYEVTLTVGDEKLYDSTVGGYASDSAEGSATGLKAMNDGALEGYVLVATLAPGQTKDIKLYVKLDGEAMDNNSSIDYSEAFGQFGFSFQAAYEDPEGPKVVEKVITKTGDTKVVKNLIEIIEEKVPLAAVMTGDNAYIGVGAAALVLGIFLIIFAGRKKKVEEES